ncbi:MAG: DNA repair protein RadA [Candidatus Dormibacterales bacterium]
MPRSTTTFVCGECGGESLRWAGQCPHCRAWNTLQEFTVKEPGRPRRERAAGSPRSAPLPVTEVPQDSSSRLPLAWGELNRVLGGGLVPGSLVLVGGEPGVGKSTLLMHLARQVAASGEVLYASGEESAQQVRMRAARLGALHPGILLLSENDLDSIVEAISVRTPRLAIVDSVQTVHDPGLEAASGSVTQVREAAGRFMRLAKESGVPVFLVGHVTKEGAIAGPRVLEHVVDTVLYLEGDRGHEFRILRATKNRFGSTDEIGIFSMGERGLEEVADASAALLEGSSPGPGSVVLPTIEGTRPLLVEMQSLVTPTPFGLPRRSATGFDVNRLHMILAVLERRAGLAMGAKDVFVNVAGGVRVVEPAADLAVALSLAGNLRDAPLRGGTVVLGELGLGGEVRRVGQLERRLGEAARRGFGRALVPAGGDPPRVPGIAVEGVPDLASALEAAFGGAPSGRFAPAGKPVPQR